MTQGLGIFAKDYEQTKPERMVLSFVPDEVRRMHTLNIIYITNKQQMYLWK